MKESDLIKRAQLEFSKQGNRLFRVNSGVGWQGKTIKQCAKTKTITLSNPRPFRSGVPKGFPDTFGWTRLKISDEMVGQIIAVFTAIEFKTKNVAVTPEQQDFIDLVRAHGGIADIIRER